jgi:dTDP-glucose 4,6-dehydratase
MELTNVILQLLNKKQDDVQFIADRIGHDQRYSVDYSKIHQELGYVPRVSFEDGILNTIEWYKNNQDWWKPLKSK